mmetsp:Transcript_42316/g.40545  ORF Transcript_42316/g.40545 Transcript_42316/m.40545 type:complete len:127 (-) Transcript_42316:348-728(-)
MTIQERAQGEKQLVYLESVDGLEALDFFLLDKERKMKDLLSKSVHEVEINAVFKEIDALNDQKILGKVSKRTSELNVMKKSPSLNRLESLKSKVSKVRHLRQQSRDGYKQLPAISLRDFTPIKKLG